jgi:hypothetical protein
MLNRQLKLFIAVHALLRPCSYTPQSRIMAMGNLACRALKYFLMLCFVGWAIQ